MDPITAKILFGCGVVAAGVAGYGLLKWHGQTVMNGRLQVLPDPAPLGGSARFRIDVRPRSPMRVNRVLARTLCLRRVQECNRAWDNTSRSVDRLLWSIVLGGIGRPHFHHAEHDEIARSEVEICGAEEWDARQQRTWDVELPLADGLPTDTHGELTIGWVAEVHFDIPSFPDVTLRQPFRVQRIYGR